MVSVNGKTFDIEREKALKSEEYKNCGFRLGSKIKFKDNEKTYIVDDILMMISTDDFKEKLVPFVLYDNGNTRAFDLENVDKVIEY
jgi:hypothetical protein